MAAKQRKKKSKKSPWLLIVLFIAALLLVGCAANYKEINSVVKPRILVIPVKGDISLYGSSNVLQGSGASAESIMNKLEEANENPTISAVILEINSPGGTIVASEEIARAVENSEKPVVAWIREVGASGGYFIASPCDKIVADQASITGSIGVSASYLQYSELMDKYGITYERLVTGEYKDLGTPFKELTAEERALINRKIDTINSIFIEQISRTRNLPTEEVEELATGEFMLGLEAYDRGLIDVLGSKEEAKEEAEKLVGISDSKLVKVVPKQSFMEQLFDKILPFSSYHIGRGIGDSLTEEQDFSLKF